MKKRVELFVMLCLVIIPCVPSWGAVLASDDGIKVKRDKYNFEYSFAAAEKFVSQKEYDEALYIYINLFPIDSARVVEKVMELDSLFELPKEILKAFATNVIRDTEMFQLSNGVMNGNMDIMSKKAKWGNALIKAVKAKKILK
jgi:hypothetical protein